MKYLTLIILNIFIIVSAANAQNNKKNITKVFTWEIPACEYKGTYDPKKYSAEQLKNTVVFINLTGSILLETSVAVFKPEDMDRLSMHKLDEEYMEKINKYKSMKVISSPYWEKLKDTIIKALEEEYKLKKITIEAYANPSVLQNNKFSGYCIEYVKALTSQDTAVLLNAWVQLAENHKKKNSSPENYMADFYKKYNSADKLLYAKVDLMSFGWWNCANQHIIHITNNGEQEIKFKKLFKNVKSECEVP